MIFVNDEKIVSSLMGDARIISATEAPKTTCLPSSYCHICRLDGKEVGKGVIQ